MQSQQESAGSNTARAVDPRDAVAGQSDAQLLATFIEQQDERAFEELVTRHGQTVMAVCRRTTRNWHDAEDVFQAAFLVLARKARSIRNTPSLGSWLFKTAYRLALRARKRRSKSQAEPLEPEGNMADTALAEITVDYELSILDEELVRLPERYRLAIMLCCVEGKSREEAARQLGWSLGALKGRLERARQMLRRRLRLRGVAVPMIMAAGCGLLYGLQAAVPGHLPLATAYAAVGYTAGQPVLGYVSQQAINLANGGTLAMTNTTWSLLMCSFLLIGSLAFAAGVSAEGVPEETIEAIEPAAETDAPAEATEAGPAIVIPDEAAPPEGALPADPPDDVPAADPFEAPAEGDSDTAPKAAPMPAAKPVPIDPAEVAALIRQLGNDDFNAREAAVKKLLALGEGVRTAAEAATKSEDAEVAARARMVLRGLAAKKTNEAKVHIVGLYESRGGPAVVQVAANQGPVILVVCAYNSVVWDISVGEGSSVLGVIASGYHQQEVRGVDAPITTMSYDQRSPVYFYASDHSEKNFPKMVRHVRAMTGKTPSSFQGRYAFESQPLVVPFRFPE